MDPESLRVGSVEWADQTTLHPVGLAMVLACGLAAIVLPRRYAVWPFILIACFVAPAQRVVVLGLDFNFLRLMVLFGWTRVLARNEWRDMAWTTLDTLLIAWAAVSTVTYTLLMGSSAAFVNRLGISFDAVGMYFVFRWLIQGWQDLDSCVLGLMLAAVAVAIAFLIENQTGRNIFSVFGGVPAITIVREGRLRCQGAFAHSILAGCFWASIMPLIAAQWWARPDRRGLVVAALAACCVIVVCCASSTPVMAVLAGLAGGVAFFVRRYMRLVRWSALLLVVCLHMVMNAPVWHLIARVSAVGGSTGWHRYKVINEAIDHFGEWWLLGTASVAHWGLWAGDVTNQYVAEGINGGIWRLALFVAVITAAFGSLGVPLAKQRHRRVHIAVVWAAGVALFVHCISFVAVSYFGQIIMTWYLSLAIIGSISARVRAAPARVANQSRSQVAGSPAVDRCRRMGNRMASTQP